MNKNDKLKNSWMEDDSSSLNFRSIRANMIYKCVYVCVKVTPVYVYRLRALVIIN